MAFTSSYTPGLIQQSEYIYATPNITIPGNISGSITSTASFGTYLGDGSQLIGVLTTASVSLNTITFTKGDGSTFPITVDTGSGGGGGGVPSGTVSGSAQITALGFVTSSATASFVLNSQTSSMSVATASYVETSQTASYVLQAVSASFATSASYAPSADAFPFVGDAVITGSLVVSGSNLTSGFRTDTRNIILGYGAGHNQNPTNGPYNVMIGFEAGYTNTIGDSNVCIGQYAGYALSTNASDDNIFIGKLSGAGSASPVAKMSDANYNIGLGYESLLNLTQGDDNISIGYRSSRLLTNGKFNVSLGKSSLGSTSTGNNNIGIGYYAGLLQTTGTGNITIGSGSSGVAGESNQLRIGNGNILTTISASLETGDIIFASTASAAYFVGDGSQLTNVASPFTAAGISGSFTAPSASFSTRVTTNETNIGSLTTATASYITNSQTSSMSVATASYAITAQTASYVLQAVSASYAPLILPSGILSGSAQIASDISGSFTAPSASFSTRITTNETDISTLTAATASYLTSLPAGVLSGSAQIATEISGAFGAPSASFSTRVTTLEGAGTPTPTFIASGSTSASAAPDTGVVVEHSGSTAFSVIGDVGTLFSVDDDLTGTLFSANDISGFPVLQADATGEVYLGKSPQSLYTTAVISSTTAATTHSLCTLSTSSYDGAFFEYTAQSASNARAGNIMSTWNGTDIVYAETTTADIGRTSDLTTEVIISGSTARLVAYGANAGYKIKTIIKAI